MLLRNPARVAPLEQGARVKRTWRNTAITIITKCQFSAYGWVSSWQKVLGVAKYCGRACRMRWRWWRKVRWYWWRWYWRVSPSWPKSTPRHAQKTSFLIMCTPNIEFNSLRWNDFMKFKFEELCKWKYCISLDEVYWNLALLLLRVNKNKLTHDVVEVNKYYVYHWHVNECRSGLKTLRISIRGRCMQWEDVELQRTACLDAEALQFLR